MATTKPEKNFNEFLPDGFATNSGTIKNDFSDTKKQTGFSPSVKDVLQGDNANYMLDNIGKQLKYNTIISDYINSLTPQKPIPFINSNNKLDGGDINDILPNQTNNNGKCLVTNGSRVSWGSIDISGYANQSLSNLNSTGEARFNGKANISLNNLNSTGEARFNGKANISLDNLNSTGEARFSNLANRDLSNLSTTGEKHFANTSLTNLTQGLSNTICVNAPTTTSSASSARPAVVIENYVNGTSWYRIWSDNKLEQGGRYLSDASGNMDVIISLLKNYKDIDYSVFINGINNSSSSSNIMVVHFGARDLTTSSFKVKISGTLQNIVWYAVGQKG